MDFNQTRLPLLLVLVFISQIPVSMPCYDDERTALLSFKSFLTDPSDRLSSWQGQNCCNWHGIHCSNTSHIVKVDLRNPNPDTYMRNYFSKIVTTSKSSALNGTISPSLFNLTHLEYIDLSFNNFHFSKIPHQFSNLINLTYLNISNSKFSGSITTQFSNMFSLKYLDLSCSTKIPDYTSISVNVNTLKVSQKYITSYYPTSNLSTRDINWLRELTSVRYLDLTGVDLSMASSASNWAKPISFLYDLRELHLSDCKISTIPMYEFVNLPRLSILVMDSNFLNSPIPAQLANLRSLTVIDFTNCQIQGSIPYIPQLVELHVGFNPDLVVNLTRLFHRPLPKLQYLFISSTKVFGSIPDSISNAPLLVSFRASGCSIQGSFPTSITNLSQLRFLDLSLNNITSSLPSTISKLKNLEYLILTQNNLQGSIPESVCEILNLKLLILGNNNLTGTIPSCIAKLQNLYTFDISVNSVVGKFPLIASVGELNLTWINLNLNKITIEIDQKTPISKFLLETLALQNCSLKGYIPHFLCNLTQLSALDMSRNYLIGTIPSCLFNLPNLSYLDLSYNNLQGTLPPSLHLTLNFPIPILNLASNNLQGPLPLPPQNAGLFDLSKNKFTGTISNEIGERLSYAASVSLSGNKLSGPIPISICSKEHALMHLDLSNNTLSGPIPSSLQYCDSLVSLNLGRNYLTGRVPSELEQMKNLKSLQLNDNNLNGTFPTFIQQFQELEVLNFQNNNFEGTIPSFIGSLHNLKIISLMSNRFSGAIPIEITHLNKLQILLLSINKLTGPIPLNISNLEMLKSRPNTKVLLGEVISLMYTGTQLDMVIKGFMRHFEFVSTYNSGIDLSCNNLEGNIPPELGLLKGLYMLNLSHNHISGEIPTSIGNMYGLEAMDFSFNKLSGSIPQSLTSMDRLTTLNLSYNNLSGRIPSGLHFDTLSIEGSAYVGNTLLCGLPTNKSCEVDPGGRTDTRVSRDDDDLREKGLLYGLVVLGFGVGFWGLFLVLRLRKEKWWNGYWRFIDSLALRVMNCVFRN